MFLFEYVLCGMNITCHLDNIRSHARPKYPPDVAQLCQYFEDNNSQLPDYCKWQEDPPPKPKRPGDI